jgi:hypothetical protein
MHHITKCSPQPQRTVARPETAGQHFSEAMRIHEAVRSPFGTATTALHWGQLLLDHDPPRARTLLALSADIAQRNGGYRVSHDRGAVTVGNEAPVWPSPTPGSATTTSSVTSRSD